MKKVLLYVAGTLALVVGFGIGGCGVKRALKSEMNAEVRAELASKAQAVQLEDGVISYGWQGPENGPVVVLVHGFSVPRFVFDLNVKALAGAGFRVLTYDHFGRGYSDRPDATYDADFYERELDGLLNALNVTDPIYLVGYSMGGGVAAVFAGRHPERIKKLALIAPIGFLPEPEGRAAIGGIPVVGDVLMTLTGENTLVSRLQENVDAGHAPAYFLEGYKKTNGIPRLHPGPAFFHAQLSVDRLIDRVSKHRASRNPGPLDLGHRRYGRALRRS